MLLLMPGCKKKDTEPTPDKEKFALPVWQWEKGVNMTFNKAAIPAIDEYDNSFYFIRFTSPVLFSLSKDGVMRWQVEDEFELNSKHSSSVILDDGRLFFYNKRTAYCYNSTDGSKVWSYELTDPGKSIQNLLVKNHELWLTYSEDGKITLIKLDASGNRKWDASYGTFSFNLGMAAYGDKLFLLNKALYDDRCEVVAVAMQNGDKIWQAAPQATSAGEDISIDGNGNIYFSTYEGSLISLSGNDGSLRWEYTPDEGSKRNRYSNQFGVTILPNNDVIFPSGDLICFDEKGHEKWRSTVNSGMSFTLGNNNILYGWGATADIKLFAVDAGTGEKLSIKFSTLDPDLQAMVFPPAITHGGNLIMAGVKKIHCITSMSTGLEEAGWAKPGRGYGNNSVIN